MRSASLQSQIDVLAIGRLVLFRLVRQADLLPELCGVEPLGPVENLFIGANAWACLKDSM
jgi:hypothetical protein